MFIACGFFPSRNKKAGSNRSEIKKSRIKAAFQIYDELYLLSRLVSSRHITNNADPNTLDDQVLFT